MPNPSPSWCRSREMVSNPLSLREKVNDEHTRAEGLICQYNNVDPISVDGADLTNFRPTKGNGEQTLPQYIYGNIPATDHAMPARQLNGLRSIPPSTPFTFDLRPDPIVVNANRIVA